MVEQNAEKSRKIIKVGRVVSDKMDKTVVVAVDYLKPHPLYRKIIRKTNKFHAHDEENACKTGDIVRIEESRPLSRTKRWRVIEIVKRGEEV
jgi:small subunit ribosomal protein S17